MNKQSTEVVKLEIGFNNEQPVVITSRNAIQIINSDPVAGSSNQQDTRPSSVSDTPVLPQASRRRRVELSGQVKPIKDSPDVTISLKMTNLSKTCEELPVNFHYELFSTTLRSSTNEYINDGGHLKVNSQINQFPLQSVQPNESCDYELKLSEIFKIPDPTDAYTLSICFVGFSPTVRYYSNKLKLLVKCFVNSDHPLISVDLVRKSCPISADIAQSILYQVCEVSNFNLKFSVFLFNLKHELNVGKIVEKLEGFGQQRRRRRRRN